MSRKLRDIVGSDKVVDTEIYDFDNYTDEELKESLPYLKFIYNQSQIYEHLDIHYPAYYVKGKNGAYIFNMCLVPENLNNEFSDYSYYRGVYIDLNVQGKQKGVDIFVDGTHLYSEYDIKGDVTSPILRYILDNLTGEETELLEKFLYE